MPFRSPTTRCAAFAVAPAMVGYTQLPWVMIGGFLIFDNLPDRWTLIGAAIIVGGGLYTVHRGRIRAGAIA